VGAIRLRRPAERATRDDALARWRRRGSTPRGFALVEKLALDKAGLRLARHLPGILGGRKTGACGSAAPLIKRRQVPAIRALASAPA